jgi:hypothetical protein
MTAITALGVDDGDIARLIECARALTTEYLAAVREFRNADSDIAPRHYTRYDELRADFGERALELVQALVASVGSRREEDA